MGFLPSCSLFLGFLSTLSPQLGWVSQCVCSWMGVGRESCRKWDVKHPHEKTGLGSDCEIQQLLLSDQNTHSTPNSPNITAATSCGNTDSHVERFRLNFRKNSCGICRFMFNCRFMFWGYCDPHTHLKKKSLEFYFQKLSLHCRNFFRKNSQALAQLPRARMESPSLEGFKNCRNVALGDLGQGWPWQFWLTWKGLRGLFQP